MRMRLWQQGKPVEWKASFATQKLKETPDSLPQGVYNPGLKTNFGIYINTLHSLRPIAKKFVNFAPHKVKFMSVTSIFYLFFTLDNHVSHAPNLVVRC